MNMPSLTYTSNTSINTTTKPPKPQHDKIRRAHEYEQRRKEKEAAQLHRERLRVELAKDKAERAADRARKEGKDPTQQKLAYTEAYDRATGKGGGVASDGTGM